MRSNSRTITVSYDQACLHDELFKENMAFQQCSDGDECKHFGPEKRTSAPQPQAGSFGGYGAVDTTRKKQTSRKRTVSFSPATCKVIHIDHQTEGLEHELWYSQSDFVFFEDQAWQCSQAVQECAARGSFDGDIGHILGLEKMLLCESYLDRRDALRNAVTSMLFRVLPRKSGGDGEEVATNQMVGLKTLRLNSWLQHQKGILIGHKNVHSWLL